MTKKTTKARIKGAYIVKAAETRPSRVHGKVSDRVSTPSSADKTLVNALLRARDAA